MNNPIADELIRIGEQLKDAKDLYDLRIRVLNELKADGYLTQREYRTRKGLEAQQYQDTYAFLRSRIANLTGSK